MGIYLELIRLNFLKMMAYRLRYYTGIVTYVIHVAVYWFIWRAVFSGRPSVDGLSLPEMTTYLALGYISRSFYFNYIDRDIQSRVSSGDIALDLARPYDFQLMNMANAIGESLFRLLILAVPAGIVICLIFPVIGPASFSALSAFLLFVLLAFLINLEINFIFGLIAFYTKSLAGIWRAKFVAMDLMTGLIVPIAFYPLLVQKVLFLTPFPYIANVPLLVYLGKIEGQQFFTALLVQILWVVALFLIGRVFWKRALRSLTIQGG